MCPSSLRAFESSRVQARAFALFAGHLVARICFTARGTRPETDPIFLIARFRGLERCKDGEGRINSFIDAVAARLRATHSAMRANPRAIRTAQRLQRHRESDHFTKEVIEPDHRTSLATLLQFFSQAQAILGESLFTLRIQRLRILESRARSLRDQTRTLVPKRPRRKVPGSVWTAGHRSHSRTRRRGSIGRRAETIAKTRNPLAYIG